MFVVTLAVLKLLFGFPISIAGSLVLSAIFTGIFALLGRRWPGPRRPARRVTPPALTRAT